MCVRTHTHIHKRQLQLHSAPNEGAGTIEEIFILGLWEGIKILKLCQTRNLRKLKYISLMSSDLKRQFCEVFLTGSVIAGTSIRIMTSITANML